MRRYLFNKDYYLLIIYLPFESASELSATTKYLAILQKKVKLAIELCQNKASHLHAQMADKCK